jgi:hypothetical protein
MGPSISGHEGGMASHSWPWSIDDSIGMTLNRGMTVAAGAGL